MAITCVFAVVIGALVMVLSGPLMSMFTKDDEIKRIGQQFLWTVSPFYAIISIKIINDGVFRGAGAMKVFMIVTFFDLGLRVIASYVLPLFMDYPGIWWAFPLGWVSCTVLSVILYRFGRWSHAPQIRNAVKQ